MNELGARLRAAREAAGVSLNVMAAKTHYSKPYLSQLERGIRAVNSDHGEAYSRVLNVSAEVLRGAPGDPLGQLLRRLGDEADTLAPPERERLNALINQPRSVDHSALESLGSVLGAVRRLEDETSAGHVTPMVDTQRDIVATFAAEARSHVRPAVVGLLSELEQYRGWLAIPGARWRQSRQHLDRAAVLAMEADDPLRLSTALSFAAYGAIRRRELRTADALSAAASRDTRVHTGLRTYETYQRAEVLARSGERIDAVRLLSEADGMVDNLPPEDELPPSGYWYTAAFFLGQHAFVLRALGDRTGAAEAARDCLAEMPEEWSSSEWAVRRRELAEVS
ncbi:helix-turn-helix transcriptional regulator [Amycolatopsis sp. PS_44_ISF1]|uniref:helix-turn-helix domain-containing protein n=1 Tax=Amycolatopsis sp. PS_44_ISF1 TaxID=2974917 RepID=UPI0028E093C6|nr:helix-turn-helix transcriptional regulator [Amycolatopsis sp. PS_44_ISF1]MDT8915777.1 helix-turn-helix domain-containing protein [Amycolatopsis sp. PS_44_ISF1]